METFPLYWPFVGRINRWIPLTKASEIWIFLCLNKRFGKQIETPVIWDAIVLIMTSLFAKHYSDLIMGAMASQITNLSSVYSTVYWGTDQRPHQSSASLAFVWGIHRWSVNSPRKWPVTRKVFPFDDVIMINGFIPWTIIMCNTFWRWAMHDFPRIITATSNDHYSVSNYRSIECLFNGVYRLKVRVTVPLWEEFTGHWWIPRTKGQ